jgi:His/Glu/Gln/Arg/opine family amino acid ABC transporter permease subunit
MADSLRRPRVRGLLKLYRSTPWWIIILSLIFVYAGYNIVVSPNQQDILLTMLDRPMTTTENKFDVVYEVETEVIIREITLQVRRPNGDRATVAVEEVVARGPGTLVCDKEANPGCLDESGEVATFGDGRQALVLREDWRIRFEDGHEATVRPNRTGEIMTQPCEGVGDEDLCVGDQLLTTVFRERISGKEVDRDAEMIYVRTVDEQTVFIPTENILSMERGSVACDRDANPRCEDFEGTVVERQGTTVSGELTLESNRAINVIPEGETRAVEIRKSSIVEETRSPEGCRVEDEGACLITVRAEDDVVAGRIVEDTDDGLLLQTVAPVVVEVDADHAVPLRRSPLDCALNNLRGCNAGIWLTLLVTVSAYSIAFMLGLIIGLMRVSSNKILFHLSTLYVEIVRGMPLLVLLLFFAFVIGPVIRQTESIFGIPVGWLTGGFYNVLDSIEVAILGEESFLSEAVLGLAIGYAAFLAEVFRAGIRIDWQGPDGSGAQCGHELFPGHALRHSAAGHPRGAATAG